MTSRRATALVAAREMRESFRRKTLWVVFAILLVGSSLAMILPEVIDNGPIRYDVALVSAPGTPSPAGFENALRASADIIDAKVKYIRAAGVRQARQLVDDSKADVAVVAGRRPLVIVRAEADDTIVAFVRQALATTQLRSGLAEAGLDQAEVNAVLRQPPPRVQEVAVDQNDRFAAAAILSVLLYLVLILLMMQAANGVAIEKANRISEVLLAVVRPGPLLFGKVIGVGLVGLTGLAIAAIPVLVKAVAGGDLPAGLGSALAGSFAWIILGLILYLTIAGALGALVERQEEVGSVVMPLSLLLVGTYILAQNAGSALGAALAIFPLTSPIVMPTRIALGDASGLEIVASLLILIATVVLVVRVGAAIFRRGIVHTGRRLRLGEALRAP